MLKVFLTATTTQMLLLFLLLILDVLLVSRTLCVSNPEPPPIQKQDNSSSNNDVSPADHMTPLDRTFVLLYNNGYRSAIARGLAPPKKDGKPLPTATNMNLLNYSALIEYTAVEIAARCDGVNISDSYFGINRYFYKNSSSSVSTYAGLFEKAFDVWSSEPSKQNIPDDLISTTSIANWANMCTANFTQIGCAVVDCSGKANIVCIFGPNGKVVNAPVYEKGKACDGCSAQNSSCETTIGLCTERNAGLK